MMRHTILPVLSVVLASITLAHAQQARFELNDRGYFQNEGVDVMAFDDFYPEGHQGGVSIIQHDVRVASNGDLRLEPTPGQWSPVPKQDSRDVDTTAGVITTRLSFPDPDRDRKGFNPIDYPDLQLDYSVRVEGVDGGVRVTVDLEKPLPDEWIGKVGFNLELFPSALFGNTWQLGPTSGVFPTQAEGSAGHSAPLASGSVLRVVPEDSLLFLTIESSTGPIELYDQRLEHNNGWFIARTAVPAGAATAAIEWFIYPNVVSGWMRRPVIQVSQVGYHPNQSKVAVVELDRRDRGEGFVELRRVLETGGFETVISSEPQVWGEFLRYRYLRFDFSEAKRPGTYVIHYRSEESHPFRIDPAIFAQNVWQPTLEYFLPVQMCHMRVEEKYRVWHGACHLDDARLAQTDYNHFDGYVQGPSTLTDHEPGETVPYLNRGGWHDAGDDDLRIESQADEVFVLASAYEMFEIDYDETTVDQDHLITRIHEPDGVPDLLQQIEHGLLTILGGYRGLGRLYRGIIVPTLPQYVMIGDWVNQTDNDPGTADDRRVFTEQNPGHEFTGIAALAIGGRVLAELNPELAAESIAAAEALWHQDREVGQAFPRWVSATVELLLTTEKEEYRQAILDRQESIIDRIGWVGWTLGRVLPLIDDANFAEAVRAAVAVNFSSVVESQQKTPYGVPYEPNIWGAGWGIQRFGVMQYFLHDGFPDIVSPTYMLNALNFVLGVHPGSNTASFASGVGAHSVTAGYGFNRADWAYIPGGVVSGTALIRPDFPELKDFPYLWQQAEYVMGGGATNFMFLVMAADEMLGRRDY